MTLKRTELKRDVDKTRAFLQRGRESGARSLRLGNGAPIPAGSKAKPARRKPISPASPAQKLKCAGAKCVVCADSPCDPAHVIPRTMGAGDDPLDVVPLCRTHHRAYDSEAGFDLLPYLEPRWRDEVAQAVRHVGLVAALQRITNARWSADA